MGTESSESNAGEATDGSTQQKYPTARASLIHHCNFTELGGMLGK